MNRKLILDFVEDEGVSVWESDESFSNFLHQNLPLLLHFFTAKNGNWNSINWVSVRVLAALARRAETAGARGAQPEEEVRLTHSLTHSLRTLTPTLTPTLTHSLWHSITHSHVYIKSSLTNIYSFWHPHSFTRVLTVTFTHSLTHSYMSWTSLNHYITTPQAAIWLIHMCKSNFGASSFIGEWSFIWYTTLHYTTLHYTTLHCSALNGSIDVWLSVVLVADWHV